MKSSMKNLILASLSLFALALTSGCSTSSKNERLETVWIVGTNDIHGALTPVTLQTRDPGQVKPTTYEVAGVAVLGSYVRKLRAQYSDHFLWLDAGDEFQGSLESNMNGGAPMVDFFNLLGLNAAAIGNHEFDFGLPNLKARMKQANYPYLAANIVDKTTGRLADFPNTYPHQIFSVGHLKIGVIGLSTLQTPTTTRAENVANFDFEDLSATAIKESKFLREAGANIVVITAHSGLSCDPGQHPEDTIRTEKDVQGSCDKSGEMDILLSSLPPGVIDAVVSGHTHTIVHHWVNGIPVIQGSYMGKYINVIALTYDWGKHELVTDKTQIEGPIPICEKVFQNRGDCNGDVPDPNRGALVRAHFRGQEIFPDPAVVADLKPIVEKTAKIKDKIVTVAAKEVEQTRKAESPMGNLVADAIRSSAHADFAVINSGGIRAPWNSGKVTYGDVYRTLPFDNFVMKLKISGHDLKNLLNVVESGSKGISPVSGLKIKMVALDQPAPPTGRILQVTENSGKPINDIQMYTVATLDFLVQGGDDWNRFIRTINPSAVVQSNGPMERDAVVVYLKKMKKPINTDRHPLLDLKHPRFTYGD